MSEFRRELPPEHYAKLYGSAFHSFKQYPERVRRGFSNNPNEIEETLNYEEKLTTVIVKQYYPTSPDDPLSSNLLTAGAVISNKEGVENENTIEFVTGHELVLEIQSPIFGAKRVRSYLDYAIDMDTGIDLDKEIAEHLTKFFDETEPTPLESD